MLSLLRVLRRQTLPRAIPGCCRQKKGTDVEPAGRWWCNSPHDLAAHCSRSRFRGSPRMRRHLERHGGIPRGCPRPGPHPRRGTTGRAPRRLEADPVGTGGPSAPPTGAGTLPGARSFSGEPRFSWPARAVLRRLPGRAVRHGGSESENASSCAALAISGGERLSGSTSTAESRTGSGAASRMESASLTHPPRRVTYR